MNNLITKVDLSDENATNSSNEPIIDTTCQYYHCYLTQFSQIYDNVHNPLTASICLFGIIGNTVNIAVLTSRHMWSPTNTLLTGLSIAHLLLAINYIALIAINYYRMNCVYAMWSLYGAYYRYLNVNMNIVFHTIAFAHTILLALFRFAAVKWPAYARRRLLGSFRNIKRLRNVAMNSVLYGNSNNSGKCRMTPANRISIVTFVSVPVLCLPVFFTTRVKELAFDYANCSIATMEPMYDLNYSENELLNSMVFWLFGIIFKLVPSFILIGLVMALLWSLKKVGNRHYKISSRQTTRSCTVSVDGAHSLIESAAAGRDGNNCRQRVSFQPIRCSSSTAASDGRPPSNRYSYYNPRTTKLLVAVVLLCAAVELPHGILNLATGIYGHTFASLVYDQLGSFVEMLTLLYSSINFVLYITMNADYMATLSMLSMKVRRKLYNSRCLDGDVGQRLNRVSLSCDQSSQISERVSPSQSQQHPIIRIVVRRCTDDSSTAEMERLHSHARRMEDIEDEGIYQQQQRSNSPSTITYDKWNSGGWRRSTSGSSEHFDSMQDDVL